MPTPPPRDAAGNTLPHDHAEITNEDFVVRYTSPNDLVTEPDGRRRLSSGTYSESSDVHGGMSVVHQRWIEEAGLDVMCYAKDATFGATQIRVGDLRAAGHRVGYDPLDGNEQHCAVWDIGNGSKRKRRVAGLATTVKKCEGES